MQDHLPYGLCEEMPISHTFKFLMNIQLTLVLFLALSWLYDASFFFGDVALRYSLPNTTCLASLCPDLLRPRPPSRHPP
jgi:hypothetical protein